MRREGHTYVFRTIDDKGDTDYMHDSSAGDSIFPSSSNPQKDIYEWIKDTYYECRGPELAGVYCLCSDITDYSSSSFALDQSS